MVLIRKIEQTNISLNEKQICLTKFYNLMSLATLNEL